MTPPICGMPNPTNPDLVCENPPTCSLPVPTLVEDERTHTSRVVDVAYCAEELSRMSPPPALAQRLNQLARRHYRLQLRPTNPATGPHAPATPPVPAQAGPSTQRSSSSTSGRRHPAPQAPGAMDAGVGAAIGAAGGAAAGAAGSLGRAVGRFLRALGR